MSGVSKDVDIVLPCCLAATNMPTPRLRINTPSISSCENALDIVIGLICSALANTRTDGNCSSALSKFMRMACFIWSINCLKIGTPELGFNENRLIMDEFVTNFIN